MLIVEPVGGLCNRMRVLDGALDLARASGRPLTVVWRLEELFPSKFEDLFEPLPGISAWHDFDVRTQAGREARDRFRNATGSTRRMDPHETARLLKQGTSFVELLHSETIYVETWSRLYFEGRQFTNFRPRAHLHARIAALTDTFSKTVGVHIRRTDSKPSIVESPTDRFIRRMRQMFEEDIADSFFLATDDPAEERAVLNAFPGKVLRQERRTLDRRKAAAMEDAVVDLYSLAATRRMLGSYYSSFSATASAIGGIYRETVHRVPQRPSADREVVLTFGIHVRTVSDPAELRFRSRMLSATLASIYAQTDGAFRVLIAAGNRLYIDIPFDERLEFIYVEGKPAETLGEAYADGGRKIWQVAQRHAELGGGPLMIMDMDDFVSNRLVEFVRANPHPNGYVIENGFILDARSSRYIATDQFHRKCGSSAIINEPEEITGGEERRFARLRKMGHVEVAQNALDEGRPLMAVPFPAAVWTLNHGGNLSWLRETVRGVAAEGSQRCLADIERHGMPASNLAAEFTIPDRYPLLDQYFAATGRMAPTVLSIYSGEAPRRAAVRREVVLTFGIKLKGVTDPVELRFRSRMLSATLASIYAQTDGAFRVIVAGSNRHDIDVPLDDRFEYIDVPGRPAQTMVEGYADGGRKSWRIAQRHAALGGGPLMFVDMDDFVSNRLVEFVRANPHPNGCYVEQGYALNARSGRYVNVDGLHRMCGSSVIINLSPEDITGGTEARFVRLLRAGHAMVVANAIAEGRPLGPIPFAAAIWVLNHGGNMTWMHWESGKRQPAVPAEWLEHIDRTGSPAADIAAEFTIPNKYPLLEEYVAAAGRRPLPSLSVCIVTHRRPAGLKRLLAALLPQVTGKPGREIVVVNNNSHDDAYEAVRAEFADAIKYRALPENVGVATARNASVELATGDYLVFTDDDCEPPRWWLDWLAASLEWASDLDVVAGPTLPIEPERWTFFAKVLAQHSMLPGAAQLRGGITFATANVAIRGSLFRRVGGFGFPGPFHGASEDTELSVRLARSGASARIDESWYIRHEVTSRFFQVTKRYWRSGYANGALHRLTTSPEALDALSGISRRDHFKNWLIEFRQEHKLSGGVSRNRLARLAAAFLASLVRMAYRDGWAAALRDRDRSRAVFGG